MSERKYHNDFAAGLGWMYATACALADKGKDIRKVEVPDLISDAERDCARCENPRTHEVENSLPQSTDHQVWAKEFNETAQSLGYPEMDEEWLEVWFANAICAGRDADGKAKVTEVTELRKLLIEMITAIQEGLIDSPEIGGCDDIPVHRWHEQWLYNAEQALMSSKQPCDRCEGSGVEDVFDHGSSQFGDDALEPIRCSKCDGFGHVASEDLRNEAKP